METINVRGHYTLDEQGNPVEEINLLKWAEWSERNYQTPLTHKSKYFRRLYVSTSFLGMDHSFGRRNLVLWETMIFKRKTSGEPDFYLPLHTKRYETKTESEVGHKKALKLAKLNNVRIMKRMTL